MEVLAPIAAVGAAIAVMALLFKPLFDDFEGFAGCIRFWFKPDFWSWLDGEGFEDWWAEMKLGFWFALGTGAGFGVYALMT